MRKDFTKKLLNSVSDAAGGFNLYDSAPIELRSMTRVAVIKIKAVSFISDEKMSDIGITVARLARLGLSPVIVIDPVEDIADFTIGHYANRKQSKDLTELSERIANAIEKPHKKAQMHNLTSATFKTDEQVSTQGHLHHHKIRRSRSVAKAESLPALFTQSRLSEPIKWTLPHLLLIAITNKAVPIVPPLVYIDGVSRYAFASADDIVYEIVSKLSGINEPDVIAVDKVIYIEPRGGIPSKERNSGAHILVNLEQESEDILSELHSIEKSDTHIANLNSFRKVLAVAPKTTSGLITTPEVAGLQSTRNPLIYNLLTDRPVISSSLPVDGRKASSHTTTLLRHGMPVMMFYSEEGMYFPDPASTLPWQHSPQIFNGLKSVAHNTEVNLDMQKLVGLIENSFGKNLDVKHYLNRINGHIAGVVIAGDYEGGAIITWEYLPNGSKVAYLDKLAVLRKNQGSAGVADIVFKAMVMQLFPSELIWRSRTVNPVNKWYFERSKGSMKLPRENKKWTMFWTGVHSRERERLADYAQVCSSIEPSLK